jgi:hypothetical protein
MHEHDRGMEASSRAAIAFDFASMDSRSRLDDIHRSGLGAVQTAQGTVSRRSWIYLGKNESEDRDVFRCIGFANASSCLDTVRQSTSDIDEAELQLTFIPLPQLRDHCVLSVIAECLSSSISKLAGLLRCGVSWKLALIRAGGRC